MTHNSFRQALLHREVVIGTWLQINNATAAEVLANVGFDWIAIDIEHTDIDITSLTALLRGMYGRGAAPIARVATNDVMDIRRALDTGAEGVLMIVVSGAMTGPVVDLQRRQGPVSERRAERHDVRVLVEPDPVRGVQPPAALLEFERGV